MEHHPGFLVPPPRSQRHAFLRYVFNSIKRMFRKFLLQELRYRSVLIHARVCGASGAGGPFCRIGPRRGREAAQLGAPNGGPISFMICSSGMRGIDRGCSLDLHGHEQGFKGISF